jgi:hypothetical protein
LQSHARVMSINVTTLMSSNITYRSIPRLVMRSVSAA